MQKPYIPRDTYINKIRPYIDKELIKVLVGQRRVGKSYLLFQLMDEIKKSNAGANIVYINKELYEFKDIITYEDLMAYLIPLKHAGEKCYLFIDEIQDITEFEKALRSLLAQGEYDIYCTGSNARILSGELATLLSGRYIEIKIYSLSYNEFIRFHSFENTPDSFNAYLKYGGLPYLANLELTDEIVYEYLRNIYNTIVLKDIVERYKIRNVSLLQNLTLFLADNLGSIVSAKRISEFLKSQRIDLSVKVIIEYLSYLCNVFFVSEVKRANIIGRKIFEIGEKYYFEDVGLRNALIPYKQADINKLFENLVYRHLLALGYTVTIGQLGTKEIDFVAEQYNQKIYVQVAYLITDEQTTKREFGNLLDINDNYPKYVVSSDTLSEGNYKGIKHLHIQDFLTKTDFQ